MPTRPAASSTNASCVNVRRSPRHKPSLHRHVRFQLRDVERKVLSRRVARGSDAVLLRRQAARRGAERQFLSHPAQAHPGTVASRPPPPLPPLHKPPPPP